MAKTNKTQEEKSLFAQYAGHVGKVNGSSQTDYPETDAMVRYFKKIMSEDEARLGLLGSKVPMPAEKFAELSGFELDYTEKMLWNMAEQGVLFAYFVKDKPYYNVPNWAPGIVEYMIRKGGMDKEIAELFNERAAASDGKVRMMSTNSGAMRVLPVMKEIAAQPKALSYEQVLGYLDQVFYDIDDVNHEHPKEPLYSVADCACRTSKKLIGEGCSHPIEGMCIQIGPEAEYYIRTGRGRQVTREEVLEVLDKAEKAGCVHEIFEFGISNMAVGQSTFICNCCGCSCGILSGNFRAGGNAGTVSNYKPEVDPEKCVACGACVEKCPANAIRLGDRLCTECEAQVDVYETAKNFSYGKEKFNYNYRDRILTTSAGTSPCKTACPAHVAVQGYIRKASEGDYQGALEVIRRENPFPAVCGRICYKPCEEACSRNKVDEAVAIDEIKRFIAEQDLNAKHRFIPEIKERHDRKIAIIGGGPAGLTAAYYLAIEGYPVTVFEKRPRMGGMLMNCLPSFRLEKDVLQAEIDLIRELGVEFRCGVEVGKDVTIQQLRQQDYKAFYVAIGAQKASLLQLDNGDLPEIIGGVDFLDDVNSGKAKLSGNAVVVGGGNVAIDVARAAVRCGAEKVSLFCLESREEMPALDEEINEAVGEGIEIINGRGPRAIIGKDGHVAGIEFRKCVSVTDGNGNFAPVYDESDVISVEADTVLLAIGQRIELGSLFEGEAVETDRAGRIIVDPVSFQSSVEDIFAGGDVVTGPQFSIDAIAMGKQGFESLWKYVEGRNLTLGRQRNFHEIDKDKIAQKGFDTAKRQQPMLVDPLEAKHSFKDLRQGLSEEQVQKEVARCLGCGRAVVDTEKCIGCGVCTVQCKFDAVHLKWDREHKPTGSMKEWKSEMIKYVAKRSLRVAKNETLKKLGIDPLKRKN